MEKRAKRERREHAPACVVDLSILYNLFPTVEAEEVELRSVLLAGLERWLATCNMTQAGAAQVLQVTQQRVLEIKRGKVDQFSLDLLVRLGARAGLQPKLELV
jgi:predicted XRE-type DNA-binding protein